MNGPSAPLAPNPAGPNDSAPLTKPQTLIAVSDTPIKTIVATGVAYTKFVHAAFVAQGLLDLDTTINPYHIPVNWDDPNRGFPVSLFLSLPHEEQVQGVARFKFLTAAAICIVEPTQALQRLRQQLPEALLKRLTSESPTDLRKDEKAAIIRCMSAVLVDSFVVAVAIPSLLLEVGANRPPLAYQILVDLFLVPLLGIHYRLGRDSPDGSVNRLEVYFGKIGNIRKPRRAANGSTDGDVVKIIKKFLVPHGPRRDAVETDLKILRQNDPNYAMVALTRFFTWALHKLHNDNDSAWIDKITQAFAQ